MSKVAEAAYDAATLVDWQRADADATIAFVAERLSILSYTDITAPSHELARLAGMLRTLIVPPTCRWCGKPVQASKSYWGLGAVFCSPACRDEALVPPTDEAPDDDHA